MDPAPACDRGTGCVTCGDEASAMTVLAADTERGLALCADAGGRREEVETALVAPVVVGEELLVHAGTAIGRDAGLERTARKPRSIGGPERVAR